jgi:aminoglycoside phosphotransferase family enzyme/predicted kinase
MNNMQSTALPPLITALLEPRRYPHPVNAVELIETHISWVLLAGEFAYKIKKPVALGFLDFSTLAARRHYCVEELRLNRITAPQIYLDVVPIGGSAAAPSLNDGSRPLEYALRMRRFDQAALLDRMARRGELTPVLIDRLAEVIATFHAGAAVAAADSTHGSAANVCGPAQDNFSQLAQMAVPAADAAVLLALRAWTDGEGRRIECVFAARRAAGRVRECHGDLHLGNIALIDGAPLPFDCIEFNAELRWIDVISEIAFLVMDLFDRNLDALAWRFLDSYLQLSGDYEGIAVLRYYLVYRAMVRAKVTLIHARQLAAGPLQDAAVAAFSHYLRLAQKLTAGGGALMLMHGLSGSGKSRLSQMLAAGLGALRVRSDVERKRLAGLAAGARSASAPGSGLYDGATSARTYARLCAIATTALAGGWRVIVDAASLRRAERAALHAVARAAARPFVLVTVEAPVDVLRERLVRRAAAGNDASEADAGVLEFQLAMQEPLDAAEHAATVVFSSDGSAGDEAAALARVDAAISAAISAASSAAAVRFNPS